MKLLSSRSLLVSSAAALAFLACSSTNDAPGAAVDAGTPFDSGGNATADQAAPLFEAGAPIDDAGDAGDAGTERLIDTPPAWCGPSGAQPPPIGGTLECPADKNLPGCACATVGEEATCWTGYRRHRGLGQCKDGRTKCLDGTAGLHVWGACEGVKLPDPSATDAVASCSCFSAGNWKIANAAPCIWADASGFYAYSTAPPSSANNCTEANHLAAGQKPAVAWSTSSITLECPGKYKLCYRIRQGDAKNPKATDCLLGESCVDVDYAKAGVEQATPPLPAWNTTDSACVKKWETETPEEASPGYYEMLALGQTYSCDAVGKPSESFLFSRKPYCARKCRDAAHQGDADCQACRQ